MQAGQNRTPNSHGGIHDILVTGSSGFLGSQFVTRWLARHPEARAACLVRGDSDADSERRLCRALQRAVDDGELAGGAAALLPRATAIRGGLDDLDWSGSAARWHQAGGNGSRSLRVLHCAANLSFRAADREAVRAVNIDGTQTMLDAATRLSATEFNYVSTAYVAGDRTGDILEDEIGQPGGFTNPYEESKWEAEALVRRVCTERRLPYRIFRPSIIIADSVTHRLSASSGFYKVVEMMMMLGRMKRNEGETILLPIPADATIDLIPVDIVVDEMVQLLEAGAVTHGQAFHLTSDNPLPLVALVRALSPLSGMIIGRLADPDAPVDKLAEFMMQRLRYYMPYFGQTRRFDRGNVRASGVARQRLLDVERMRPFVTSFLARTASESMLVA